MGFHVTFVGRFGPSILYFLLLVNFSVQNVHVGVDLVTRLSNNWIPTLIKEISEEQENVVASPYGVMSNLAMIFEGADEKTREEIFQALNMTSEDVAGLRKGFKAYCGLFLKYSNDPEAAGSFNSASMKSSFKLNSSYKEVLEKYYCANITESVKGHESEVEGTLEFSSIAGVMSHWKDYEKLSVYTFLSHRPTNTFKRRNGSTTAVPMIPQVGVFKAGRWENSKVVLIPLQAKLVDFLVIMPEDKEQIDAIAKKLTEFSIPLLVQSLRKQEVEVFIPQTAVVNKNFDLKSAFMRNGIRRIFDGNKANFSRVAPIGENGKIHLTKLEQNAFFSTSFVAVNSVAGISSSSGITRTKRDTKTGSLYINQPFLFFVIQRDTQLVLLGGKIENPLQIPF